MKIPLLSFQATMDQHILEESILIFSKVQNRLQMATEEPKVMFTKEVLEFRLLQVGQTK